MDTLALRMYLMKFSLCTCSMLSSIGMFWWHMFFAQTEICERGLGMSISESLWKEFNFGEVFKRNVVLGEFCTFTLAEVVVVPV